MGEELEEHGFHFNLSIYLENLQTGFFFHYSEFKVAILGLAYNKNYL